MEHDWLDERGLVYLLRSISPSDGTVVMIHGAAKVIRAAADALERRAPKPDPTHPVFAFLNGSGPLEGRWFGDDPPRMKNGRPRPYWWRTHLSAALAGAPAPVDEVEGQVRSSEAASEPSSSPDAEVVRLREALEKIRDETIFHHVYQIADAALRE